MLSVRKEYTQLVTIIPVEIVQSTHFGAHNYTLVVLGSMQKRGTFSRGRWFLRSHTYIFARISCVEKPETLLLVFG